MAMDMTTICPRTFFSTFLAHAVFFFFFIRGKHTDTHTTLSSLFLTMYLVEIL